MLFRLINLQPHPDWLDQAMLFISNRLVWSFIFALLLAFAVFKKRQNLLIGLIFTGLAVGLTDYVTYQFLKPYFARPRPCHQTIDFRLVQEGCGGDWGFPSNHAANGGAVTGALGVYFRRRALTIATGLVSFAVGLSRIYLGAHFPGDVLAGFAVGGSIGIVFLLMACRLIASRRRTSAS